MNHKGTLSVNEVFPQGRISRRVGHKERRKKKEERSKQNQFYLFAELLSMTP